jgi:glycosyltransferase involved in cell wall biosynthesis
MKILMMSHYFASHKGGIEIVAEELFRGLAADAQEVVWMAGDATSPPASIGASRAVPLCVLNGVEQKIGLPFPIPGLNAVSQIKSAVSNADILILHDCLYLTNILAFLFARFRRVPTLIIQHTRYAPNSGLLVNAILKIATATVTKRMLTHAEQVVFISKTSRNCFRGLRFRNPPEIVFNGVDASLYRSLRPGEQKTTLRAQYRLPEQGPVILFVGRFVEKKGLPIMKRMVEHRPDWTWAFAGWGPLNPEGWNCANVRVFSDLRGPAMAALYRAADLLVLPSTGEGFPLVIQEALASGLPVVCSDETLEADPSMKAYVQGVPVYADNAERTTQEFLCAIQDLLDSQKVANKSEEHRAFAVSRYSWPHATKRYAEIASRLVLDSSPQLGMRATTGKVVP